MSGCRAEVCAFWTGHGCACEVLDLDSVLVEHERWCEGCSGPFEAAEETSLCPDCEAEDRP